MTTTTLGPMLAPMAAPSAASVGSAAGTGAASAPAPGSAGVDGLPADSLDSFDAVIARLLDTSPVVVGSGKGGAAADTGPDGQSKGESSSEEAVTALEVGTGLGAPGLTQIPTPLPLPLPRPLLGDGPAGFPADQSANGATPALLSALMAGAILGTAPGVTDQPPTSEGSTSPAVEALAQVDPPRGGSPAAPLLTADPAADTASAGPAVSDAAQVIGPPIDQTTATATDPNADPTTDPTTEATTEATTELIQVPAAADHTDSAAGQAAPSGVAQVAGATGAAAAAAGSPTTLDRVSAQIFPEITRLVTTGDGVHRVILHLNPRALGEVRVVLTMRDGVANVRIAAGDAARAQLLQSSPELQRMLEQAGAHNARIDVRELPGTSLQTNTASAAGDASARGGSAFETSPQHHQNQHHPGMGDGHFARDGADTRTGTTRSRPGQPFNRAPNSGVDLTM